MGGKSPAMRRKRDLSDLSTVRLARTLDNSFYRGSADGWDRLFDGCRCRSRPDLMPEIPVHVAVAFEHVHDLHDAVAVAEKDDIILVGRAANIWP